MDKGLLLKIELIKYTVGHFIARVSFVIWVTSYVRVHVQVHVGNPSNLKDIIYQAQLERDSLGA